MSIFISSLVFIFGAIIGSFLNVVIYRYHTGKGVGGRSQCMVCGKILGARELVPILSFFLQRGRCRKCASRISFQYPLVEVMTGTLFLLIFNFTFLTSHTGDIISFLYYLVVASILIVIIAYDMRHTIIPDSFAYSFAALAFLYGLFVPPLGIPFLWFVLSGPLLAAPFALLWVVSQGRWMGLGDAKLALGIGWFLGWYAGISALILAFWIGAAVGIALLFLKSKRFTMKSEIPFGPFLVLGMWLVFFCGIDLLGIQRLLM